MNKEWDLSTSLFVSHFLSLHFLFLTSLFSSIPSLSLLIFLSFILFLFSQFLTSLFILFAPSSYPLPASSPFFPSNLISFPPKPHLLSSIPTSSPFLLTSSSSLLPNLILPSLPASSHFLPTISSFLPSKPHLLPFFLLSPPNLISTIHLSPALFFPPSLSPSRSGVFCVTYMDKMESCQWTAHLWFRGGYRRLSSCDTISRRWSVEGRQKKI